MPTLPLFQVDAFTDRVLTGNPAAVMPLAEWLPDDVLQALAAENNLAETAFFVAEGDGYAIRWFTPLCEVPLCGHATLASAFVLFTQLGFSGDVVRFTTRERGTLEVRRGPGGRLVMDFPAGATKRSIMPEGIERLIGARPMEAVKMGDDDILAVLDSADRVRTLVPRLTAFAGFKLRGLLVTAEAAPEDEANIVCRYFAPGYGIPEDPATGSAHTFLVPFWAPRLGKTEIASRQLSPRGGRLYCRHLSERTEIAGDAVLYMRGEVTL
jgi:PhzF family phenazine biosynthesis protein